uniref:Uncharacterized protein n=2 Tax=Oryza TaxID=4527 RepID=A0A0D3EN73_9ORYZ
MELEGRNERRGWWWMHATVVSVMEKVRWCQLVAKAADDDDCGGDYLGTPTMAILEAEDDEDMPLLPESLTCRGGELPPYHRDSLRG